MQVRPGRSSEPMPSVDDTEQNSKENECTDTCCVGFCLLFSYLLVIILFPFSLGFIFRCPPQYEKPVVFRMGRIRKKDFGPGVFHVVPCADKVTMVDLRTQYFDVPRQEILTKDGVSVILDAVVYYKVLDPVAAVTKVDKYGKAASLLAQTALRNAIGLKTLSELLTERRAISTTIAEMLDEVTLHWGVDVERVEIVDVKLPSSIQKSMAIEAEAQREARAKVIGADGEQRAARALKEAADIMNESPITIQLRYLQTLSEIASERTNTIVFPIPVELLKIMDSKGSVAPPPRKSTHHSKDSGSNALAAANFNYSDQTALLPRAEKTDLTKVA